MTDEELVEALFAEADKSPDNGEGSLWHIRNGIAHDMRQELKTLKDGGTIELENGDILTLSEWRQDAAATLKKWKENN